MNRSKQPIQHTLDLGNDLVITPGQPLKGVIGEDGISGLPGDKSISHRAALFASFADGVSQIGNFQVSGVTRPMLKALADLGTAWELKGNNLLVSGQGFEGYRQPDLPLNCGNSATTMRLLTGAVAASGITAILDGSPGLRKRPMNRIVEPLQNMGVDISSVDGCAPLWIKQSRLPLKSIAHTLTVSSAQVKSCLLLAALRADEVSMIREPELSRDHTERMLSSMGVEVNTRKAVDGRGFETRIVPPVFSRFSPLQMSIPGDFSAAAFLIVAACITPGSRVEIRGVGVNPTRTGLLDALKAMGAKIEIDLQPDQSGEPVGNLYIQSTPLKAIVVSGDLVVRMIDEFPIFAIAAAYASGKTEVHDATELRYKESDRIADLAGELRRLGLEIEEYPDGFSITGGKMVRGGSVNPHGDHRLAMSFAVAGLAADSPVTIENPTIISESFPGFVDILASLGARVQAQREL